MLGLAGLAQQGAAQTYTLNVNTALTQDDPLYKGLEMFEAAVEERTGGDLDVVILSALALGKGLDRILFGPAAAGDRRCRGAASGELRPEAL